MAAVNHRAIRLLRQQRHLDLVVANAENAADARDVAVFGDVASDGPGEDVAPSSDGPADVVVPDAEGMTFPEAARVLERERREDPKDDESRQAILETDPPYGAAVKFDYGQAATGWHAPQTAAWLEAALETSSVKHFGKGVMWMGEGGTIPFMAMLGEKFPRAQFFITGVLGPHSNAHGPNEFLHIPTAKRLTCCVAEVIAEYGA